MISKEMQDALNEQINAEFYSSYLYSAMSAYCESVNLRGTARWLSVQAREEWGHGMKLYGHLIERGGRVQLKAIAAPPMDWESPTAVFEEVRRHEQKVTGLIHKLVELASAEKDHAAGNMLQWFVNEQVEEEANAEEVLQKVKALSGTSAGMVMLDQQLGSRKAD